MQGIIIILVIASAVAAQAIQPSCPSEQSGNLEKLLQHEDCNKFYICTLGVPVEMECPHGLHFSLDLHQCDWMNNVNCEGRNDPNNPVTTQEPSTTKIPTTVVTPTTTVAPTTTLEPSTTQTTEESTTTEIPTTVTKPHPEVNETTTTKEPTTEPPVTEKEIEFQANGCPVDPHVHWLLPDEKNCTVFYYCVWGSKVQSECPSTLHFNRVLQVCDWPMSAGCTVTFSKHRSFSNIFSRMF